MNRVRIIGGGLTGVLAAFQAHRLGCRDIELHERLERLGATASPAAHDGVELSDGALRFGPRSDPVRALLGWHGLAFEEFEDHVGSVSPGAGGLVHVADVAGPALPCPTPTVRGQLHTTLAGRLRAYPPEVEAHLSRYCRWRLNAWLNHVQANAAGPLGIARVYPLGADLAKLADEARRNPALADLYEIPAGRPLVALPRDGAAALFRACQDRLQSLGVRIHTESPVSPAQLTAAFNPGDVVVWAADPAPLFAAVGLSAPKVMAETVSTHVFRACWTGAMPFRVRNFTATGSVAQVSIHSHRGQTLVAADCLGDCATSDLRRELQALLAGFPGDLRLDESLGVRIRSRPFYGTVEAMRSLGDLRTVLARRFGPAFVPTARETGLQDERFAAMSAGLAAALEVPEARAVA